MNGFNEIISFHLFEFVITKTWVRNDVTLLKEAIVYVSKFIKHWSSYCDICVWRSSKGMFRHVKFYLHELVHCDVSVDSEKVYYYGNCVD